MSGQFQFPCGTDSIKILVSNGSGSYTYQWDDGTDTQGRIGILGATNTVTVTDLVTNCVQSFSHDFWTTKPQFYFATKCQSNIEIVVSQAYGPFTYEWSTGETTQTGTCTTPGQYCVTVTNSLGCTASGCANINNVIAIDNTPINCDRNYYELSHVPFDKALIGGSGFYVTELKALSIFMYGLNFKILVWKDGCSEYVNIKLPQINSLNAIANNTTCSGCSDGYVTLELGNSCYQCTIGDVKILKDDQETDVTELNAQHLLAKGHYWAIVEDANSGCYIGYKEVTIN